MRGREEKTVPQDPEAPRDELSKSADAGPERRKPYAKPAVISREPLEAVAAVCNPPGKADPFACPAGPVQS